MEAAPGGWGLVCTRVGEVCRDLQASYCGKGTWDLNSNFQVPERHAQPRAPSDIGETSGCTGLTPTSNSKTVALICAGLPLDSCQRVQPSLQEDRGWLWLDLLTQLHLCHKPIEATFLPHFADGETEARSR